MSLIGLNRIDPQYIPGSKINPFASDNGKASEAAEDDSRNTASEAWGHLEATGRYILGRAAGIFIASSISDFVESQIPKSTEACPCSVQNRAVENMILITKTGPLVVKETPTANFYGWFYDHGIGWPLMSRKVIEKIMNREPNLVIVPENVISGVNDVDAQNIFSPNFEFFFQDGRNDGAFDDEASKYVQESRAPVFVADLMLTYHAYKNYNACKKMARGIWENVGIGALGRESGLMVEFRNALIAAKILRLVKEADQEGIKLSFLITMGMGHAGIMTNLENGLEYNLKILERYKKFALSSLGPYWDKGYLLDLQDGLPLRYSRAIFSVDEGFLAGAVK